jgi:hypothetical protein
VANTCWWYISFFKVAKNVSAAALPQHTPVRPIDWVNPLLAQ